MGTMTPETFGAPRLWCPQSFALATADEIALVTNGCGSSSARFDYVPDTLYGLSIKRACIVHDWEYFVGATHEDKQIADRRFLDNMLLLIDAGSAWQHTRWLRHRRAVKYYQAVRLGGGSAFWGGKMA